jgi:hypothetical protein
MPLWQLEKRIPGRAAWPLANLRLSDSDHVLRGSGARRGPGPVPRDAAAGGTCTSLPVSTGVTGRTVTMTATDMLDRDCHVPAVPPRDWHCQSVTVASLTQ